MTATLENRMLTGRDTFGSPSLSTRILLLLCFPKELPWAAPDLATPTNQTNQSTTDTKIRVWFSPRSFQW